MLAIKRRKDAQVAKKKTSGAGRPKGARNRDAVTVLVQPANCPKCGSSERTRYTQTTTQLHAGTIAGEKFNQIVRRWCRCLQCDQWRIEQHYELTQKQQKPRPDGLPGVV